MRKWARWVAGALAGVALLCVTFALGRCSVERSAALLRGRAQVVLTGEGEDRAATAIYAHNLALRKGEHFRIYVRWIRGRLLRTHEGEDPSFDAPQSFVLQVDKGVISVAFQDLNDFLNGGVGTGSPLRSISLGAENGQLVMHGVLHKLVPLPVKINGDLTPLPDGRVQFHVQGMHVAKLPVKGMLSAFRVKLSDLVASQAVPGVEIDGNNVRFDTATLLPPPHIHGQITAVVLTPTEMKVIYGHAGDHEDELNQWHNFLRFTGGNLGFGKLTMHGTDLTMIDATPEPWFDLDLVNYHAQLASSYTRMTENAGLEIYMPALHTLKPKGNKPAITMDWLKNRNSSLPGDVPFR